MGEKEGIVDTVEEQENRWRIQIGNFWASLYENTDELGIKEGDKVEIEWERIVNDDGKEDVIKSWSKKDSLDSSSLEKNERMDRGVALKAAARVSDNPEEAEKVAKRWYRLLRRGDWNE